MASIELYDESIDAISSLAAWHLGCCAGLEGEARCEVRAGFHGFYAKYTRVQQGCPAGQRYGGEVFSESLSASNFRWYTPDHRPCAIVIPLVTTHRTHRAHCTHCTLISGPRQCQSSRGPTAMGISGRSDGLGGPELWD